ncbi:type II secretion system F family protein [Terrilactibacillus sp. S3-3]|nr:type II secretion system F family protein [Terrilactibacillus sp. S3-3]
MIAAMFIRKKMDEKRTGCELLISIGGCLRDGYPLHLAIQLQAFQKQPFIRKHINMMLSDLKKGRRLHRILQTLQFPNDVCSYVYFAEESGELAKGLNESGQMLKKREEQKEALQKLMRYPLLLFWVFSLMIFVIGHYLLPNFLKLYRSLAIDLPLITKIFLFMSGHIYYLLFFLVLILLTAVIFFLCVFAASQLKKSSPSCFFFLLLPTIRAFIRLIKLLFILAACCAQACRSIRRSMRYRVRE